MRSELEDEPVGDDARELWDALAHDYDERHGDEGNDWHRVLVEPATLALLGDVRGRRVLDLGCGTGVLARRLWRLGAHVLGADGSTEFLERAWQRPGGASIDWTVVDALDEDAIAALGAFDAVACTMVLMDLPDLAPLFRGVRRVLSQGPFVVATAHPSFNRPDATFWREAGEDASGAAWSRSGLKLTAYARAYRQHVYGMADQQAPQWYFHRPLHELLGPAFDAGFVLDALREPTFPTDTASRFGAGFPPILVFRLRPSHGVHGQRT